MNLMQAMATFEGFGADPNNRPTRNNNPGNITWGPFAQQHGATHIEVIPPGYTSKPTYAYFPDADTGWSAMQALLLSPSYASSTIRQALTKWAPPSENDTESYIMYVCQQTGESEDAIVSDVLQQEGL